MNYSRFLAHREQESNLELIAGLLDLEALETVTATEGPFRRNTIETVKPGVRISTVSGARILPLVSIHRGASLHSTMAS